MLRDAVNTLRQPWLRLLDRTVKVEDSWRRIPCDVPLHHFGAGAQHDFPWYFDGESRVEVTTLEEIKTWLLGCTYVRDVELFREVDFWQHPCTFEHLRKGDCEDFALWAWRKLVRLGHDAELVAGRSEEAACSHGCHTWVMLRGDDGLHLFDPVVREPAAMILPLDVVRDGYVPEVGVDARLRRYAYGGYYQQRRTRLFNAAAL